MGEIMACVGDVNFRPINDKDKKGHVTTKKSKTVWDSVKWELVGAAFCASLAGYLGGHIGCQLTDAVAKNAMGNVPVLETALAFGVPLLIAASLGCCVVVRAVRGELKRYNAKKPEATEHAGP